MKIESFVKNVKNNKQMTEEDLRIQFVGFISEKCKIPISKMNFEKKNATGFTDLEYKNILVEFKKPRLLKKLSNRNKAIKQINSYLSYLGSKIKYFIIFDGHNLLIGDKETQNIDETKFVDFNDDYAQELVNLFNSAKRDKLFLSRKSIQTILDPISALKTNNFVNYIYKTTAFKKDTPSGILYKKWLNLFELSTPDSSSKSFLNSIKETELKDIFGEDIDLNKALFSLHTLFSIVVKYITFRHITNEFRTLKQIDDNDILREKFGIFNFIHKDIFAWYTFIATKNEFYKMCDKYVTDVLSLFDINTLVNFNDDFFIDVYETIIPHGIRKSLGEYYTPPKFALSTMEWAGVDFSKKIVDPACGSGSFLVGVINEKIKLGYSAREITEQIAGIDLNPVATIAAKANVLINLKKIKKPGENIFLPIFTADSILTKGNNFDIDLPSSLSDTRSYSFYYTDNKPLTIKRRVLDHLIFKTKNELISFLETYGYKNEEKAHILSTYIDLKKVLRSKEEDAYKIVVKDNLYLMTLNNFDYIVGNPPWVKWSNLPLDYREKLKTIGVDKLFSPYKNSGGNSLDLFAAVLKGASTNFLKNGGEIAMLMPMSLNFNPSMETVRQFNFLEGNYRIRKIKHFSSKVSIFKGVSLDFGAYLISKKNYKLSYEFVSSSDELLKPIKKYPVVINNESKAMVPFDNRNEYEKIKRLIGKFMYKVRSGVQFSPNKVRQFRIIEEQDGIVRLRSAKTRKEQKKGIPNVEILAEKEAIVQVMRSENIKGTSKEKYYSWFLYPTNSNKEFSEEYVAKHFPILWGSIQNISKYLSGTSGFNSRISKSKWYGNTRVGAYTTAPYRIMFSDNGAFKPILVTDKKVIPEGHVRFIPLYNHAEAIKVFNALNRDGVSRLIELQTLKLNRSFKERYINIGVDNERRN